MAVVYLAEDTRHRRRVAVKVLRPELGMAVGTARFLREIQIEARLQHPNILPLLDSGAAGPLPYYIMPYVEGESLRGRLRREKQLPLTEALQVTREIADALEYAHAQGVIHRDIKPANILFSGGHALLADFGVARAVTAAGTEPLTETGLAVGTPHYMSPEQGAGDEGVDGRADIYALGCVLYEMLAGEPPFGGRTPQAILARHRQDDPPSIRVVRPTVPVGIQEAIERALAKVPADRFASAAEFARALDRGSTSDRPARSRRSRGRALAISLAAVTAAAVLGVWQALRVRAAALDPNRVVVFPLRDDSEGGRDSGAGEGVATYIGYALEGAEPLKWLDGWDLLLERERSNPAQLSAARMRQLTRSSRARFFIDGAIVRGGDSVTVVLRVHDAAGDSLLGRAGAAAAREDAAVPQLGLRAVGELLPALLPPGRSLDLSALSERRPVAVAAFLQGEREYRRMHFSRALEQYEAAIKSDSVFSLAALKGAQSAYWLRRDDEAQRLVRVALANAASLLPRYRAYGLGLDDYLLGRADSAARHFEEAVRIDPGWSEGWMALGEVYYHLLPRQAPPDSLAEAAFERARQADRGFTPPLFHLAEIALRRGDLKQAQQLIGEFRRAEPDSTLDLPLSLMLSCVRDGAKAVDWQRHVRVNTADVLKAAKLLSVAAAQPECASAGFWAVFTFDSAAPNLRWGALLGLQGLLAAAGRTGDLRTLLDSKAAAELTADVLYLPAAAAGIDVADRAAAVADRLGRDYRGMSAPVLWALGTWETSRGNPTAVEAVARVLSARVDSSGLRRDSLLASIMQARTALARRDSAEALRLLSRLTPSATGTDLEWQPWEALGGERLILAQLEFAHGRFAEAYSTAALLDAPEPIAYLTYLPASLSLREHAARGMGSADLARRCRVRLATLLRASILTFRAQTHSN